jgi:hypothetical protein
LASLLVPWTKKFELNEISLLQLTVLQINKTWATKKSENASKPNHNRIIVPSKMCSIETIEKRS